MKSINLILLLLFSLPSFAAGELTFLCQSGPNGVIYREFDQAHILSYCQEEKNSFFGKTAVQKAYEHCETWAKEIGFDGNFLVEYFTQEEFGGDPDSMFAEGYKRACLNRVDELKAETLNKGAINEVHFALLNTQTQASHLSGFLLVDNFDRQMPYYYESGSEMAQWFKATNGDIYCGKFETDLAIRPVPNGIEVMRPSNPSEIGFYKTAEYKTSADRTYEAVTKLSSMNADYFEATFRMYGGHTMSFFNMNGAQKTEVANADMLFSYFYYENGYASNLLDVECR